MGFEEPDFNVALGGFIAMLVIHTSALFYWGGSITRAVKDHDRRLSRLEARADAKKT